MTLNEATLGTEYLVKSIDTDDDDLKSFLLTLGCYEGATLTVVTRKKRSMVLAIKDARYSVDTELAEAIVV